MEIYKIFSIEICYFVKVQKLQTESNKINKLQTTNLRMFQSPLRKNKHSYPIDFSTKKKQSSKYPSQKYDLIDAKEANPETLLEKIESSAVMSRSSVSELFVQTNRRNEENSNFQFFSSQQPSKFPPKSQKSPILQDLQFFNQSNFQQIEEPLKQVKKKNNRIIVDESKLKNPRIQINEQIAIATNQQTLQTISPQKVEKQSKTNIGGIRHQDFKYFQLFEDEKQIPLLPQKPFNIIHKNTKRQSLLQKVNLNQVQKESQNFQSYTNSQITSGRQSFRPQTYTYANRIVSSSEQKLQKRELISRINSSIDSKKKDKIVYMNNKNLGNLLFALPNLPLTNGGIKFNKFEQESSLKSKIVASSQSIFSKIKSNHFSENKDQNLSQLESDQISKLKAQINMISNNRFKNREDQSIKVNETERQFIFQGSQKNHSKSKQRPNQIAKQIIPKATKKLEITYHVPLTILKRICRSYISSRDVYTLAFKVPKIFMEQDLFSRDLSKQQLYENGLVLFESLKINSKDMIIKRYSNCLMFICGHIVVMWYYNGKRYLGGWQYEYLDQGSRHGLGLQWQPDSYIYYGQFRNNKRHGLGAMKEGPEKIVAGYWQSGKYIGTTYKNVQEMKQQAECQNDQQLQSRCINNHSQDQQQEYHE